MCCVCKILVKYIIVNLHSVVVRLLCSLVDVSWKYEVLCIWSLTIRSRCTLFLTEFGGFLRSSSKQREHC